MKHRYSFAFLAAFLMLSIGAGCSNTATNTNSASSEATTTTKTSSTSDTNTEAAAETAGEVKEITMTAKQYEFTPSSITVAKGTKVKLTITSEDLEHGFSLPDFNVQKNIKPGETAVVEFVADKAGEFVYSCHVFCGTGHTTMKGKLIVQ